MELLTKLICAVLLLIGAASKIQSKTLNQVGLPLDFTTISANALVKFGGGIKPTYFPVIEYPSHGWYEASQITNYTVYTRKYKCQSTLKIGENMAQADVEKIWQLTDNKIIIVWNIFEISKQPESSALIVEFVTKVIPIDMKTCENGNSVKIPWDLTNNKNFVEIVPYKNGFDVISSIGLTNSRTRYDVNGNQIGKHKVFSVDVAPYSIQAASTLSRSKGLFVINKNSNGYEVLLTKEDFDVVERLSEFKANELITNFDQSNYTICWNNFNAEESTTVNCVQFNEFGMEYYREKKVFSGRKHLLEVKNLKRGGFLLFTLKDDGKGLEVTKLHPHGGESMSTYELRSAVLSGYKNVVELDEENNDFIFAYVYHSNDQHRVILRKYHLMN